MTVFARLYGMHQGVADLVGVGQDIVVGIMAQAVLDGIVGCGGDAVLLQMLTGGGSEFRFIDKERRRASRNKQIADEDGIAVDVGTT